jgi:hypothetical protein
LTRRALDLVVAGFFFATRRGDLAAQQDVYVEVTECAIFNFCSGDNQSFLICRQVRLLAFALVL